MIAFHTLNGFISLIAGLGIMLLTKGTKLHKAVGWIYTISMYTLCLISFFIFKLYGGFGVYHVMTLISTATLTAALIPVLLRGRIEGWLNYHYRLMLYSYVGLVMALNSHFFTYLPVIGFALKAVILWGLPYGIGLFLIERKSKYYRSLFQM